MTDKKLRNKRSEKYHEPINSDGLDITNLRSSAFICGSFSSDPYHPTESFSGVIIVIHIFQRFVGKL